MKKVLIMLLVGLVVCCGCENKEEEKEPVNIQSPSNETIASENNNDYEAEYESNLNNNQTSANNDYSSEDLRKDWETVQNLNEDYANDIKESVSDVSLTEEKDKYVIKQGDNMTGIYYHNGKDITGYEVRVSYDSHEEAELAKSEYVPEEGDNIESIKVDGKDIVVKYSPDEYSDMSLEDVKQTYEMLKIIQGN